MTAGQQGDRRTSNRGSTGPLRTYRGRVGRPRTVGEQPSATELLYRLEALVGRLVAAVTILEHLQQPQKKTRASGAVRASRRVRRED